MIHTLKITDDKIIKSRSLPFLFYRAYGFDSFKLDNLIFHLPEQFNVADNPAMSNYLYDSVFYTYVSMYLTRSERDKFIKMFRRTY